jgi:hypothetical protein
MYNVKFILYTYVFSGIKTVNHGILDIAEDKSFCWINTCPCEQTSLTATETALTEAYLT